MASFASGPYHLAYDDLAPPSAVMGTVLLVHGFASNRAENWRRMGWYNAFARAGYRVVAPDLRGHGESDKPHDPAAYGRETMAGDVFALMDHLDLPRVTLMGYSMGAYIALTAALMAPHRVERLILGGIGGRMFSSASNPLPTVTLSDALLTEAPDAIADPIQRGFRRFAEAQGDDREALAACSRASNGAFDREALSRLMAETLVVAGAQDELAEDPQVLADVLPHAKAVRLSACDHFSAIPHALFKAAVFDFLEGWDDEGPVFE
jgi:pimeloyl-ACP methyl ester carboxylesterase